MRKLFITLPLLLSSIGAVALPPLTQFCLVKVQDNGASFRDKEDLARILSKLNFQVNTYNRPDYLDEMDEFVMLEANRKKTIITLKNGEDIICTIDFATKAELNTFVESMNKSGYKRIGNSYSHPSNNIAKIYIRVNDLKVRIICPFEMLPENF